MQRFPKSTYIIKVLNELPSDKRHIKVPHVENEKKQVFENFLFKCVTRPDISGVPLRLVGNRYHHKSVSYEQKMALLKRHFLLRIGSVICPRTVVLGRGRRLNVKGMLLLDFEFFWPA